MRTILKLLFPAVVLLLGGCSLLEGTKLAPIAVIEVIPQQGHLPFKVNFSAASSHDLYTKIISYEWNLGDGTTADRELLTHTYRRANTYVVSLTVTNEFGLSNTAKATVVVAPPLGPQPPGGLATTATSSRQIELTWDDRADNEAGFHIERQDPDGSFMLLDTVAADIGNYTDKALKPDTRYCYRVRAFNDEGTSEFSNQSCATTNEAAGPIDGQTDEDENDLVKITRLLSANGNTIQVDVVVEAKIELELVAIVEKLERLTLVEGELSTFVVNLQPGDTLDISYTLQDDDEDGGIITGTIRAKSLDKDSQSLDLTSNISR